MSTAAVTIHALAEIYKVSDLHLSKWGKEGVDLRDCRQVVAKIWTLRKKPPEWIDTFTKLAKGDDPDTHESLKKEKTAEEVKRLKIANAKSEGDSFDRKDGESVMAAIASALNLRLTEFQAMIPPQLEGLDAAGIEVIVGNELRKVRDDLADLESELWTRVYENYIPAKTEAPADPKVGGNRKTAAKT
jgi:hypothetical protein